MRRAALLPFLTALFVSVPAFAQEDEAPPPLPPPAASTATTATTTTAPTVDAVHLRNGGLYRGHVTEIVPGDHVTVRVESGETKRIAWSEIDRVIVASTPIPPTPTRGTAAPATTPLAAPMVGPRARVHITASKNVILYRRPAGSSNWVQACASPCNEELPIGDAYRITGNNVAASKEFHLEASPGGTVDVAVDPPSTGGMVAGGFLAGGGATAAYVGLLMAMVGAAEIDNCGNNRGGVNCSSRRNDIDNEELRNAGLITLGVGSVLTLAGILIFVNAGKTDIVQSSRGGSSGKNTSPSLDAFVRQPTWRTVATSSERAATAPAAAFPLVLGGTF
jgi:hypothetical protein